MKKICVLLFLTIFFSCSTDDSQVQPPTFDVNKLLRGWAYDQMMTSAGFVPYQHNQNCWQKDLFGFRNREGQEFQFEEQLWTGENCASNQTLMRWEAEGDHVNLYFGQYVGRIIIVELTDSSLHCILEADFDGDGVSDHQEIKAIPYDPFESF